MTDHLKIELHQAVKHCSLICGRRYRIDEPGNKADGRCGTLEAVIASEAWLKIAGFPLVRAQASNLTDFNVVQQDMSIYRVRQDAPLLWEDLENFA